MLENFLIKGYFFVICLIFAIIIRLFNKKNITIMLENDIPKKFAYILLVISLTLCLLVFPPVAGKGYDCSIFIFTADYIQKNGVLTIFRTDRPIVYFMTFVIGHVFNVPGRLSIPISGIVFSMFYVLSIFALTLKLTKNWLISSFASLYVGSSNIARHMTLNFIGNLLGLVFLNFFFIYVILFCRENKRVYWVLVISSFVCIFFSHIISATVGLMILTTFLLYSLFKKKEFRINLLKMTIILSFILILCLTFYQDNLTIFWSLVERGVIETGGEGQSPLFLLQLTNDWNSNYIWMLVSSIIGVWIILSNFSKFENLLVIWIITVLCILLLSSAYAGRIFLYFPFSIFAGVGLYVIVSKFNKIKVNFLPLFLLFLIGIPCFYFYEVKHMNIRYFQEGPFAWDLKHVEVEQLKFVSHNYDLDKIVVITDVGWETNEYDPQKLKIRGLRPGVHLRILAYVGNNVYFGQLTDLLEQKPDCRDFKKYPSNRPGRYSSLNVDWILENKTILVLTTIYELSNIEKEICYETTEGIYVVKQLAEEEKQTWLTKTNG